MTVSRTLLALTCAAGLALAAAAPAQATFPGRNGKIAFERINPSTGESTIYAINPDGTGLAHLTGPNTGGPAWSADGRWLAFHDTTQEANGGVHLWVQRADGSHRHQVSFGGKDQGYPAWSPDGTRLAFDGNWFDNHSPDGFHSGVGVVNVRTGKMREITSTQGLMARRCGRRMGAPSCSSGSSRARAARTPRSTRCGRTAPHSKRVVGYWMDPSAPAWSPDGKRILFDTHDEQLSETVAANLATVPRGGGHITVLTHNDPTAEASFMPVYAPDGHILFVRYHFGDYHTSLVIVNADGTHRRTVQMSFRLALNPDWGLAVSG